MARVTKAYQERKSEIMDTAQMLFYTQGYDAVSVNLIIDTIGISKGTFYHYFSSKEELLDELVQRFTEDAIQNILPIVEDDSLNALEKLSLIYEKSGRFKLDQVELKKLYLEVLTNSRISSKGGAGLGLIEMARKSGQKLDFSFEEYNENFSLFYLQIKLKAIFNQNIETDSSLFKKTQDIDFGVRLHAKMAGSNTLVLHNGDFSQDVIIPILV